MSNAGSGRSEGTFRASFKKSSVWLLTAVTLHLVGIMGCGSADNGRVPFRGDVTYEGEPVAYGSIALRPAEGVTGVAAGSSIKDGKFDIAQKNGPSVGKYVARFTITGEIQDNQQRLGGPMTTIEVPVEVVPGNEEYRFELPIKPKP